MQLLIEFDPNDLPEAEREALAREAVRRGVPYTELIREALLGLARKVNSFEPPKATNGRAVA